MSLAPFVVALPVLASAVGLALSQRHQIAGYLASGSAVVTALLAVVLVLAGGDDTASTLVRTSFGEQSLDLVLAPGLTACWIAMVVAAVTAAVQVYAQWYLAGDDRRGSFHATVSLFGAAMLLLVLSGDLITALIGWEVMGWCSYLLIGHWSRREAPRRAATKAFLVTRVADIGLVLGFATLIAGAGTSERSAVINHWTEAGASAGLTTAMVLIVIGVLGKSAQVPFQDWLPDAMEGPTPASALIHAATMVAAGTVLLVGLLPLLQAAPAAQMVLGVSVAITMVLAALLAAAQRDVKRLLAWSTVSQVAIMLAPLAVVGGNSAGPTALLHLYAHAVFKALLFLVLGWLALAAGGTSALILRGSGRLDRIALGGWVLGLASLAGVPLLVGGISKEHVIAAVMHEPSTGLAVTLQAALVVTVILTAVYATRALIIVAGPKGADPRPTEEVPTGEQPVVIPVTVGVRAVVVVLALASVVGGLVLLGDGFAGIGEASLGTVLMVAGLVLIGVLVGGILGRSGDPVAAWPSRLVEAAGEGLGLGRVYSVAVVTPVRGLARMMALLDDAVIGTYNDAMGWGVGGAGALGERAHRRERASTGLLWVVLGAVIALVIAIAWWPR
ncbi:NADH-quinone oxidoreductase subunit L [Janibacter sp. GXQ6167]|uniref:NADH-quinone oxidoreductase subunit 5 family protein n=1 Tax=Janibacter sp. GXQ6167 TaxID=3240791 RepID=UPI003524DD40